MSRDEDEEMAVRRRLWHLMPGALDRPADDAVPPWPGDDRTPALAGWPPSIGRPPPTDLPPSVGRPPDVDLPPSVGRPPLAGAAGGLPPPVTRWPTVLLPIQTADRAGDTGPVGGGPVWTGGPTRTGGPDRTGGPVGVSDEAPVDVGRGRTVDEAPPSPLPGPSAFDPGRRGVRALAAVAVLVVLAAGVWTWRSRPQVEPVVAETGTAGTPAPSVEAGHEPGGPTAGSTGELVVAVAGKVRRPGLVRLAAGARVADALDAAGGALPGVDVAMLNPARKISDGELILVGVPAPSGAVGPGAGPLPGAGPGAGGRVNLNTATSAQLETLPGVGPVLAQRIIEYRDQHGGFRSVGDLRQVTGIGDARYEQLKDLVTV
ncbi:helix-hairpin-helix domain-containing protein [Verrucosispora sp. WMMC514]|uniref:ComEA family DNA-binding protein n=1 Tax=Verrucosispora sp. WMMC514 TaxID=3015156 RepID=UPI0032B1F72D